MATTQKDVFLRFTLNQQEFQRTKAGIEGLSAGVGRLKGVLGALGVGLSVGGLVGFVRNAADATSQLRAMGESADLSVEQLSGLNYIARQSELSQQDLGKAVFEVNQLLAQGKEEGSKAAEMLARYGITSERIRDGSIRTHEALRLIADEFSRLPDGSDKAQRAVELFGEQLGRKVIPFLSLGSQGFDDLTRAGKAAGAVMSDEVAAGVAKANDKLSALYQTLQTKVLVALYEMAGLMSRGVRPIIEANQRAAQPLIATYNELGEAIKRLQAEDTESARSTVAFLEKRQREILQQIQAYGVGFNPQAAVGSAPAAPGAPAMSAAAQKDLDAAYQRQAALITGVDALTRQHQATLTDLSELLAHGKITQDEYNAAVAREGEAYKKAIDAALAKTDAQKAIEAETKAKKDLLEEIRGVGDEEDLAAERRRRLNELYAEGAITAEEYHSELETMAGALDVIAESETEAERALDEFAKQAAHNMQDIVAGFLRGEMAGKNFIRSLIDGLADLAAQLAAQALLRQLFGAMAGSSNPALAGLGQLFGGGLAAGGPVSGPGGPTDDRVPAMLSNGEYVIQASAVRKWGQGFLDFVNQGMPVTDHGVRMAYATGGIVGAVSHAKVASRPVVIAPVYHIDNSGGTQAAQIVALQRVLQENNRQLKSDFAEAKVRKL